MHLFSPFPLGGGVDPLAKSSKSGGRGGGLAGSFLEGGWWERARWDREGTGVQFLHKK